MNNKRIQLFIFPYAGGNADSFRKLSDKIDDTIDVITVEYAGRGSRANEKLANNIEQMIDDAAQYCNERKNNQIPYAIMGYSMGSIIAYEILAQNKIQENPKHLFISAEVCPSDRSIELRKIDDLSDEKVVERAVQLGGIDRRLLKNSRFFQIYILPMISDYKHFFAYKYVNHGGKIKCNTTFFYCEKDTSLSDIRKWDKLIDGKFDFHEYGDNHFFVNQHYEEMANIINQHLLI